MSKNTHSKKSKDRQSMVSLNRSKYFEQIDKIQQEEKSYAVANAASYLHENTFEGMYTIRFEKGKWWNEIFRDYSLGSDPEYEGLLVATATNYFIRYLADATGCEVNDMHWIATSDVEKNGVVNLHILFNYLPREINGSLAPDMESFPRKGEIALNMVSARFEYDRRLINIHFVEAYNEDYLVDFFDKWNPGEPVKGYSWSHPVTEWITHDMTCSDYKDLSPREKKIMDLYRVEVD